jgi:hypothetical protein
LDHSSPEEVHQMGRRYLHQLPQRRPLLIRALPPLLLMKAATTMMTTMTEGQRLRSRVSRRRVVAEVVQEVAP